MINAYKIVVENPEDIYEPRHRWDDDIKIDIS
jgi:hypothetical protein